MLAGSSCIGQEYLGNMGRDTEWDICRREWNVWDAASCFLQQWTSITPSQKSVALKVFPPHPLFFFLFPCPPLLFSVLFFWHAVASAILAQKTNLSLKKQSLPWLYSFSHWVSNSYFYSTSDLWLHRFGVYIFSFIGNLDNTYLWP